MSKEQETIWRRDARRKRNRASAIASRARVQQRISYLESELNLWKQKYLKLCAKLEEQSTQNGMNSKNNIISPCSTPTSSPDLIPLPSEIKIEGLPLPICPPELVLSSTSSEPSKIQSNVEENCSTFINKNAPQSYSLLEDKVTCETPLLETEENGTFSTDDDDMSDVPLSLFSLDDNDDDWLDEFTRDALINDGVS